MVELGSGVVVGWWWGQYVLGLKVSYLENYDEKMANRLNWELY
jgi:hypothetical protein